MCHFTHLVERTIHTIITISDFRILLEFFLESVTVIFAQKNIAVGKKEFALRALSRLLKWLPTVILAWLDAAWLRWAEREAVWSALYEHPYFFAPLAGIQMYKQQNRFFSFFFQRSLCVFIFFKELCLVVI
jgi:hypothetical protein